MKTNFKRLGIFLGFLVMTFSAFSQNSKIIHDAEYYILKAQHRASSRFIFWKMELSHTGFILLAINFSLGPLNNNGAGIGDRWLSIRPSLGVRSFLLIFTHLFLSLILLNPANYQKFFLENGALTTNGGLSMLAGVIAFITLWIYTISFQTFLKEDKAFIKFITSRKVILIAMVFTAAHFFFMGYQGWLTPQKWPGGLPPITLISFVIFIISYIINLIGRKWKTDSDFMDKNYFLSQ